MHRWLAPPSSLRWLARLCGAGSLGWLASFARSGPARTAAAHSASSYRWLTPLAQLRCSLRWLALVDRSAATLCWPALLARTVGPLCCRDTRIATCAGHRGSHCAEAERHHLSAAPQVARAREITYQHSRSAEARVEATGLNEKHVPASADGIPLQRSTTGNSSTRSTRTSAIPGVPRLSQGDMAGLKPRNSTCSAPAPATRSRSEAPKN